MSENPLKHYFRRPSIYIKLPSGGEGYNQQIVEKSDSGEYPVYPMSAIDEVTSRTPDALFNGHAVVDIIKSCVPAIKDPWKITSVDLDAVLIAIRIASSGDTMDIVCTCPKCNNENNFGINMVQLLSSRQNVDYKKTLKIRDLEIKFRPLTFQEVNKNSMSQYEVQKMLMAINGIENEEERAEETRKAMKYMNELTTDIITNTIDWIKTPETMVEDKNFIKEFVNHCDRQTSAGIKEFGIKLREENVLPQLDVKCSACENEFVTPLVLNYSDFFV